MMYLAGFRNFAAFFFKPGFQMFFILFRAIVLLYNDFLMYLVTNVLPFMPTKADLSLFRLHVPSKAGLDVFVCICPRKHMTGLTSILLCIKRYRLNSSNCF